MGGRFGQLGQGVGAMRVVAVVVEIAEGVEAMEAPSEAFVATGCLQLGQIWQGLFVM